MVDFHRTPFDSETLAKLEIYEKYLAAWLPVFLARERIAFPFVNIFDMFCGPGHDIEGNAGSPLIAARLVSEYAETIRSKNVSVRLRFNDVQSQKVKALRDALKDYPEQSGYAYEFTSDPFDKAYKDIRPFLLRSDNASLIFADQTGIKNITPKVFREIANCNATDFLFFTSSSILNRFRNEPSITTTLGIDPEDINNTTHAPIHRLSGQGRSFFN